MIFTRHHTNCESISRNWVTHGFGLSTSNPMPPARRGAAIDITTANIAIIVGVRSGNPTVHGRAMGFSILERRVDLWQHIGPGLIGVRFGDRRI
jgi:hypothetical protein